MAHLDSAEIGPAHLSHVVEQPWRWYEDLRPSEPVECGEFTLSEDEIVQFARRYDPQPFHVDRAAARESVIGELFASSIHTLAASVSIFVRATRRLELEIGLKLREGDLPRPMRAGVAHRVLARWVNCRVSASRPGHGIASWEAETVDPDGDLILRFGSTVMVRRRPA